MSVNQQKAGQTRSDEGGLSGASAVCPPVGGSGGEGRKQRRRTKQHTHTPNKQKPHTSPSPSQPRGDLPTLGAKRSMGSSSRHQVQTKWAVLHGHNDQRQGTHRGVPAPEVAITGPSTHRQAKLPTLKTFATWESEVSLGRNLSVGSAIASRAGASRLVRSPGARSEACAVNR